MEQVLDGMSPCPHCGQRVPGGEHWCSSDPARFPEVAKRHQDWLKTNAWESMVKDALSVADQCSSMPYSYKLQEWALKTLAEEVHRLSPKTRADELLEMISR